MAKLSNGKIKFSKDMLFPIAAVVLSLMIGGFVLYSATFLVSHLNEALRTDVRASAPPSFDIEGFEKLNLIAK